MEKGNKNKYNKPDRFVRACLNKFAEHVRAKRFGEISAAFVLQMSSELVDI